MPRQLPPPRRSSNLWKIVALVLLVLLGVSLFTNLRQMFGSMIPGEAALTRKAGPRLHETVLEYHDSRNKVAVTLDLSQEEGQELMLELLADADVLIENFRPGTLER